MKEIRAARGPAPADRVPDIQPGHHWMHSLGSPDMAPRRWDRDDRATHAADHPAGRLPPEPPLPAWDPVPF